MDPISIALGGLKAAERTFDVSANRLAVMGAEPGVDPVRELVQQIQAKTDFAANLGTIRVSTEMWRALLELQTRR